jgi:hypothetical protein
MTFMNKCYSKNEKRNTPLFCIYDDGTVEKRIIIE